MPKYLKNYTDVEFYAHKVKPGKKPRKIAGSTKATNDFLVIVHEDHPDLTILQLRDLITDKTRFILNPDAVAIMDAYIKAGEGDLIPNWR